MNIQVIGNCQARPLSALLVKMAEGCDVNEPIMLHLARPEQSEAHLEFLSGADLIVTQATSAAFQPQHLASSSIKELFPEKTIVWPNCFFSGQQPYLRYFTHPDLGRLMGPWEALHDIRLHKSWLDSGRVEIESVFEIDEPYEAEIRARSLGALQQRELECDVVLSDFIEERMATDQLFLTFNHPTAAVLTELSQRVASFAGLTIASRPFAGEPLGRYRVPSTWSRRTSLVLQGDNWDVTTGQASPGPPQVFELEQLCSYFTHLYESREIFRTMDKVRLTPDFAV